MKAMTPGGRTLSKAKWRSTHWPAVDIEPYDPAYFKAALEHIATEFGIGMPEIEEAEPQERYGLFTDFVIQGVEASALLDGRRCSVAVNNEAIRDRIYDLLLRLPG